MLELVQSINHIDLPGISSVQLLSRVQLFVSPWIAAYQASLYITNYRKIAQTHNHVLMMPSNNLIPCQSLLLLPSVFQFFASGGQGIGVSASTSFLP